MYDARGWLTQLKAKLEINVENKINLARQLADGHQNAKSSTTTQEKKQPGYVSCICSSDAGLTNLHYTLTFLCLCVIVIVCICLSVPV